MLRTKIMQPQKTLILNFEDAIVVKKLLLFVIIQLCLIVCAYSQDRDVNFSIESQVGTTTNDVVPFWMRSNQYGSIPNSGTSGSLIMSGYKTYSVKKKTGLDWGGGLSARINLGNASEIIPVEAFLKARLNALQLKIGRSKDVMGYNGDSTLTSGNWALSGNALGIPKIEISIPEYYRIPLLGGLISFKGTFAHGWLGKQELREKLRVGRDSIMGHPPVETYFHQKSLYFRLGRKDWKVNAYGGINHQAFWGSEKEYYGDLYDISGFHNFLYLVSGMTFKNNKVPGSKVGNHLGSVDMGLEYSFKEIKATLYRQFFYDAGALGHLANLRDGLTGLTLTNTSVDLTSSFRWNKILIEYLYSKNQAGELNSKQTPSGDEDYYNNHIYWNGWTYRDQNLGTAFLTSRNSDTRELISSPNDFFINNRVSMIHIGAEVTLLKWTQLVKVSFSRNYGTFRTSAIGNSIGSIRESNQHGVFPRTNQLSAYLEGSRYVPNSSFKLGYIVAFDKGKIFNNSFGAMLKLSKQF